MGIAIVDVLVVGRWRGLAVLEDGAVVDCLDRLLAFVVFLCVYIL